MKRLDFDSGAAYLALVVVLFGVLVAAENALAGAGDDDNARLPARVTLADEDARQATMAEEAADALNKAISVDLDIQLANHTSTASATRR